MIACSSSADKAYEVEGDGMQEEVDSSASIEAQKEAEEQARLDSIKSDSNAKVARFKASIPTFKEVFSTEGYAVAEKVLFKKCGFKVSTSSWSAFSDISGETEYYTSVTAVLKGPDGMSCIFKENGIDEWTMTIIGAPDVLDKFAVDTKAFAIRSQNNIDEPDYFYKKTGNTVLFSWLIN